MPVNPMYQCRIQWRSKITGLEHYGNWFDITKKTNVGRRYYKIK